MRVDRAGFASLVESDRLEAIDAVARNSSPSDQRMFQAIRDYIRVAYGRSDWNEQRRLAFVRHFFAVDVPAIDRVLRERCRVAIDGPAAPFGFEPSK